MTKHTPPNSFQLDCGCVATNTDLSAAITYCSLHKAAPELLAALILAEARLEIWSEGSHHDVDSDINAWKLAKAAIAEAGKES